MRLVKLSVQGFSRGPGEAGTAVCHGMTFPLLRRTLQGMVLWGPESRFASRGAPASHASCWFREHIALPSPPRPSCFWLVWHLLITQVTRVTLGMYLLCQPHTRCHVKWSQC